MSDNCSFEKVTRLLDIQINAKNVMIKLICVNMELRGKTITDWIDENTHELLDMCCNRTQCGNCNQQCVLMKHLGLYNNQTNTLCWKKIKQLSCYKDCVIDDIELAGVLLYYFCDHLYWYYCLELSGMTLVQFLTTHKYQISQLLQGGLETDITAEDLSNIFIYNANKDNILQTTHCSSVMTVKPTIEVHHLYERSPLLPRILLDHLCPLKTAVTRLVQLVNETLHTRSSEWTVEIFNKFKEEYTSTTEEVLNGLQCICIDTGIQLNMDQICISHIEPSTLQTKQDKLLDISQCLLRDNRSPVGNHATTYQQCENKVSHDTIDDVCFIQRETSYTDDFGIDALTKLQLRQLNSCKVLLPFNTIYRCGFIHTIPYDNIFTTPQQRLVSFTKWASKRYWPIQLVEAGFYYTGQGVIVRCFMCNYIISVESWMPSEKPSEAHARLNPKCKFVIDMNFKPLDSSLTKTVETSTEMPNDTSTSASSIQTSFKSANRSHLESMKVSVANTFAECETDTFPVLQSQSTSFKMNKSESIEYEHNVFCPETYVDSHHLEGTAHQKQTSLSTFSDGMNNMLQHIPTLFGTDTLNKTNEVVSSREAIVESDAPSTFANNLRTIETNSNLNTSRLSSGKVEQQNIIHHSKDEYTSINENVRTTDMVLNATSINRQFNDTRFKYPQFQNYDARLKSYCNWKYTSKQHPKILSEAGYFYTGNADIVRCFCCDLGLAEWDAKDDVWVEHARHSSNCWFLKAEKGEHFIKYIQQKWKQIYNPKHVAFEDRKSRLATYTDLWRTDIEQTPTMLVDAGFFYTGEEDVVRCHYCDGGLRNWESGDVPWEEHARWFPFCKFVIKMKGREYIDKIHVKYEAKERGEDIIARLEGVVAEHPLIKQLEDLSFQTNDVKEAMQTFTQSTGHDQFTLEDLVELIVEKSNNNSSIVTSSLPATEKLKEINRQLKEKLICVRCKANETSILFTNCGHRLTCETCANEIDYCPHCNKKITKRIKTFLS